MGAQCGIERDTGSVKMEREMRGNGGRAEDGCRLNCDHGAAGLLRDKEL